MKRLYSLLFVLCVASSVSAWTFTWRDEDGKAYVEHSHEPTNCTKINQAGGKTFRWHPEEDDLSFYIYDNAECAGYRAGYSPAEIWDHVASRDFHSFRVASEDEDSSSSTATSTTTPTTTTSTTLTTTTTTTTTPTTTSTTESAPTPTASSATDTGASESSGISGGAIAGIVVGAVAAIAIIGAICFFLGRRKRRSPVDPTPQESAPSSAPGPGSPPSSAPASPEPPLFEGKPELDGVAAKELYSSPVQSIQPIHGEEQLKQPMSEVPPVHRSAPARTLVELPGDSVMVEMSDTHRLNELEARGR